MDCPNDRYVNDAAICQAVVGMLRASASRSTLLAQPKGQYFAKVRNPAVSRLSFYMLGWTSGTLDSHNVLYDIMAAATTRRWRAARPISAAIATRIRRHRDKVLQETDTAKARPVDQERVRDRHQGLQLYPAAPQALAWGVSKK